jgi:hypothetical protein
VPHVQIDEVIPMPPVYSQYNEYEKVCSQDGCLGGCHKMASSDMNIKPLMITELPAFKSNPLSGMERP